MFRSPSTRRAWIEMTSLARYKSLFRRSPSTRRAWIEIITSSHVKTPAGVALHPEGVDRNRFTYRVIVATVTVALHPEGVDRN